MLNRNERIKYNQSVKWDFVFTTFYSASLLMASNLLKKFYKLNSIY